jgi:hypothetical protein
MPPDEIRSFDGIGQKLFSSERGGHLGLIKTVCRLIIIGPLCSDGSGRQDLTLEHERTEYSKIFCLSYFQLQGLWQELMGGYLQNVIYIFFKSTHLLWRNM